jgi:hypothetical protein
LLKDFPLAPSARIESSPGKAHFYWFVQGDFPLDKFRPVQEALIKHFNTDPVIKDLPRVMRLPGALHCKYVVEGEAPSAVRITDIDETRRYIYQQIVDALAQSGSVVDAARAAATQTLLQASALQRASNVSEGAFPARPAIVGGNELSAGIRDFDLDKARSAGWFLVDHGKLYGRDGWMSNWVFPMAAEAILHPDMEPQIKAVFDAVCRHSERYAAARRKNISGWATDSDVQWDDAVRRGRCDRALASTYREALALGWQWQPAAALIGQAKGSVAGASGAGAAGALIGQVIPPSATMPVSARPKLQYVPPIQPGHYDLQVGKQMFEQKYVLLDHGGEIGYHCYTNDGRLVAISNDNIADGLSNVYVWIKAQNDSAKAVNLFSFMQKDTRGKRALVPVFKPDGAVADTEFNMFRGWGVERQAGTDKLRPLLRHIWQVVCKRDRLKFRYLMRWMAHAAQHPDVQAGVAVILQSTMEGTGKSTLSMALHKIFGEHGAVVDTSEKLLTKFNAHFEYTSFVAIEEVEFAGDHKAADQLKSRLTADYFSVEGKFRAVRQVPNRLHAMMTTNHEWAVQAGDGARRWFICEVSTERAGDKAWFKMIYDGLENGGHGQFLNMLLEMKLGDFTPLKALVKTRELGATQRRTAGSIFDWLMASAGKGLLVGGGGGMQTTLPLGKAHSLDDAYERYSTWVKTYGVGKPERAPAFKDRLGKLLGPDAKKQGRNKTTRRREWQSQFPHGVALRKKTLRAFNIHDGGER